MLRVYIPKDVHIEERLYIVKEFMYRFLRIDKSKWNIIPKANEKFYIIEFKNKKIFIKDAFWIKFHEPLSYLNMENLPKPKLLNSKIPEDLNNIVSLYGEPYIKKFGGNFEIGIDIFASSFFMLTRWEEYVNKKRDNHSRFPYNESIAYKYKFINRPIVNEYAEFLWKLLLKIGVPESFRKHREYSVLLTHDVDKGSLLDHPFAYIRSMAGDIVLRKSVKLLLKKIKSLFTWQDPFDTYDYLMDLSEKYNTVSHFFFLYPCDNDKHNFKNSLNSIKKAAEKIKKRGHKIGFHPSYNTYNNPKLFKCEKDNIEKAIGEELKFGRQHFLRFEVPFTWRIWEQNNMEWDSTIYYATFGGFRSGTCYEYRPFDFIERRPIQILEIPLTVMEGTLISYRHLGREEYLSELKSITDIVKRYNGTFVYLWHNNSFWTFYNYKNLYERSLEIIF